MEYPISLNKTGYKKLVKQPSICNWQVKKNKKQNNMLTFEYWESDGVAQYNRHGYPKGGTGIGLKSGAKISTPQHHIQKKLMVKSISYDKTCDSWLFQDVECDYHRAARSNSYSNEKYNHHANRGSVDFIIDSCSGLI